MIRLQTLGALDLAAADGTALQPVLRQTKRFALLAYLAIERPGQFFRRDQLLGLFWPESDLKSGRASLSQALHFLRQHLGSRAIVRRGDEEIGIDPQAVWCDAAEFQECMAAGRFEAAMALYGGQLLPAYFVDEAGGFEQWLERKRDELQREAMRACGALADAAEQENRPDDVVNWLRRAIGYFPYEESLHRRLIDAFDRAGDRAAALRTYDELVQTLKAEFDAEPSAETQEAIKAVRTRSEALMAPVNRLLGGGAVDPVTHERTPRQRKRVWAAAVTAGLLLVAAVAAALNKEDAEDPGRPTSRIAVLFFRDVSPDGSLAYLAEGLTTNLIAYLGQVPQLEVISENGVRPFSAGAVPVDSISRALDVGTLVGGTLSQSAGRIRVTMEVIKGATGVVARTRTFDRPSGELFALLDDMSRELGAFLRASLGEQIQLQRWQAETDNVEAWQLVQRAQHVKANAEEFAEAGELSAAYAELAAADSMLARASQLETRWAEPIVLRGQIAERRSWLSLVGDRPPQPEKWLRTAIDFANRALRTDKQSAAAHELRGSANLVMLAMSPASVSQPDSLLQVAEADLRSALSIDPQRPRAQSTLSAVLFAQGRYEEARGAAVQALDADAYLTDADEIVNRLFTASFEVGDDADAGVWCDEVRRRMPNNWPAAYCDLAMLGWGTGKPDPRKALLLLEHFGAADPEMMRQAMRPRLMMLTAAVLARAGQADSARAMIHAARTAAAGDIELLPLEASARLKLNQREESLQLLNRYLELNPSARNRVENGRMFRALRESPPR